MLSTTNTIEVSRLQINCDHASSYTASVQFGKGEDRRENNAQYELPVSSVESDTSSSSVNFFRSSCHVS